MKLNRKQQEAVESGADRVLCLAPAGTGKTTVLVNRSSYLLAQKIVSPSNLLLLTFTNKAASEMQERIEQDIGRSSFHITAGTFHAVGLQMLRRHGSCLGYDAKHLTVWDDIDTNDILDIIIAEYGLSIKKSYYIGLRNRLKPLDNEKDDYQVLDNAYRSLMRENNAVDFLQILLDVRQMIRDFPDVQEYYHNRYQHVLVDEYQDTDPLQQEIIDLLDPHVLFAVGDDFQSIYSWRSADITIIMTYEERYPGAHVVILDQNYRSTHAIIDKANSLIAQNVYQYQKHMQAQKDGPAVHIEFYPSFQDEIAYLTNNIPLQL